MKIAVGFVLRPESEEALDRAIDEARLRDAHLVVVHSMRGGQRDETQQVLEYREALENVEKRLESSGISYTVREYARGNTPDEDLLLVAQEEEVDLIVIGMRRRSPVGKLVLGSLAQSILLNARCPVLAVPAPDED